jgi:hypothetical protein
VPLAGGEEAGVSSLLSVHSCRRVLRTEETDTAPSVSIEERPLQIGCWTGAGQAKSPAAAVTGPTSALCLCRSRGTADGISWCVRFAAVAQSYKTTFWPVVALQRYRGASPSLQTGCVPAQPS